MIMILIFRRLYLLQAPVQCVSRSTAIMFLTGFCKNVNTEMEKKKITIYESINFKLKII